MLQNKPIKRIIIRDIRMIDSKNRIVIPQSILEIMKLKTPSQVVVTLYEDGSLVITKKSELKPRKSKDEFTLKDPYAYKKGSGKAVLLEDEDYD